MKTKILQQQNEESHLRSVHFSVFWIKAARLCKVHTRLGKHQSLEGGDIDEKAESKNLQAGTFPYQERRKAGRQLLKHRIEFYKVSPDAWGQTLDADSQESPVPVRPLFSNISSHRFWLLMIVCGKQNTVRCSKCHCTKDPLAGQTHLELDFTLFACHLSDSAWEGKRNINMGEFKHCYLCRPRQHLNLLSNFPLENTGLLRLACREESMSQAD